jgi:hypothetical protein
MTRRGPDCANAAQGPGWYRRTSGGATLTAHRSGRGWDLLRTSGPSLRELHARHKLKAGATATLRRVGGSRRDIARGYPRRRRRAKRRRCGPSARARWGGLRNEVPSRGCPARGPPDGHHPRRLRGAQRQRAFSGLGQSALPRRPLSACHRWAGRRRPAWRAGTARPSARLPDGPPRSSADSHQHHRDLPALPASRYTAFTAERALDRLIK